MNEEAIRVLARRAGIAADWTDAASEPRRVSMDSLIGLLTALGLPCGTSGDLAESKQRVVQRQASRPLLTATVGVPTALHGVEEATAAEVVLEDGTVAPVKLRQAGDSVTVPSIRIPGYHRLRYGARDVALAVAPKRCITLEDIAPDEKLWGLTVQIYSLRRPGDDGIGDSGAVAALAEAAARYGAHAVTLSPTHALFPAAPERYGPYSPSNRLFLNPLLADPSAVLGEERVFACRRDYKTDGPLIDWPGASRAKYATLRRLFADFTTRDGPRDFEAFVREGGERLAEHARFEAAQAGEPANMRYYLFQQWIAARAFASAHRRALAAGMKIGLITDLAVGIDRGGSEASTRPADLLNDLRIGAPPDAFNPAGQDWGLTSFSPHGLISNGFESFIAVLRAALRSAGGIRIDHAMGLMRLWLIPDGAGPAEGAYLSYPVDDLMRLLALESQRHRAIVIGEDLGTVPPEFRRRCHKAGIAGMDVLWFQRDGERFRPPTKWRSDAVAMTTTHDLPTVAGWWQGADISARRRLGRLGDAEERARKADRRTLWSAFDRARVAAGPQPQPDNTAPAVDSAIAFVATAPSPLTLVPLEDIVGATEQPNLPGTIHEYPNWRHRFDRLSGDLLAEPGAAARMRVLRERGS